MGASTRLYIKEPHCALICGSTGCGKTKYALDLLEGPYSDHFDHVVILCPTLGLNKTYKTRAWIREDREVFAVDPGDALQKWLRFFHLEFRGEPTLFIIDDCSARKAITQKKDMLSELAFSGRHAGHSVWVLTQKYNSVLTDFREQVKWAALFYCKDRDSFNECLRENDVVPREKRAELCAQLRKTKHSKLVLRTEQPTAYMILA